VSEIRYGRERVRAGLKKELGRMVERCGQSPRWVRERGSAEVAGKTELTRGPHGAARERARGRTVYGADKAELKCRESGHAHAMVAHTDRSAPPGRARDGARVCECRLSMTGGTHLSGGEGAHTCGLARLGGPARLKSVFPFSLDFQMLFFLFSQGIQIKFKHNS
jgi:hypothetical protein